MIKVKCECCGDPFEAPTRATKICDSCRRYVKAPGVHKKASKKKIKKPQEKGPDMTRCRTCHYSCRYSDAPGDIMCDYLSMEGHSRGCEPGKDCTKYKKREGKRVCWPW